MGARHHQDEMLYDKATRLGVVKDHSFNGLRFIKSFSTFAMKGFYDLISNCARACRRKKERAVNFWQYFLRTFFSAHANWKFQSIFATNSFLSVGQSSRWYSESHLKMVFPDYSLGCI